MKFGIKCQFKEELNIFYGPIIQITEDDLDLTLTEYFEKRFQNKAGYALIVDGIIIK